MLDKLFDILFRSNPKLTDEQKEQIDKEYLEGFINKAKELSKQKGENDAKQKYK